MIIFFLCCMRWFFLHLDSWIFPSLLLSLSVFLSMEKITMPTTYERHPLEILQRPPEAQAQLWLSKQLCDDKEVHLKNSCAPQKKKKKNCVC